MYDVSDNTANVVRRLISPGGVTKLVLRYTVSVNEVCKVLYSNSYGNNRFKSIEIIVCIWENEP